MILNLKTKSVDTVELSDGPRRKRKMFENMSEKEIAQHIAREASDIQYVSNPSVDLQKLAVLTDSTSLSVIKNPDISVQYLAVKRFAFNISKISKPSEELQLLAISRDPRALAFIQWPTVVVQILAFRQDSTLLQNLLDSRVSKLARLYWKYKYEIMSAHQRLEIARQMAQEAKKHPDAERLLQEEGIL